MLMTLLNMPGSGIPEMSLSFETLTKFERVISGYTGAPYVVLTDSCTHAIELCLRYKNPGPCWIPYRSYLSIPMTFIKLGIPYCLDTNVEWEYEYRIAPTNIWDSARAFDKGMYRAGALQCLSFGFDKRLPIGHGGAILTNKKHEYETLKCMAYDGRDLTISPWKDQINFKLGFHYNMRLEDAQLGIQMMANDKLLPKYTQAVEYPDLTQIQITE